MADKTIWVDGVEVNKDDFEFEQNSRIEDIRRRTRHFTQVGILEGLDVKVNSVDNTKIDVSAGSGYCGSEDVATKDNTYYGEYLQLKTPQTLNAPSGGWVVGTVYYVNLVYAESLSILKPHEDGVSSMYTRVTVSPVLEIIKKVDYDSLSDIEKQKRLRLAKIIPSTTGIVVNTDIEKSLPIVSVKYASQPVSITGVTIIAVSSDSTIGVGTLDFAIVGSDRKLKWKDPGDSSFGAEVIVNAGGDFYLYAFDAVKYIKVNVVTGALPASAVSENITISSLYDKEVDVFSSNDRLHRGMIGTGIPSPANPHGLSIDDIGGTQTQELKAHRNIQHANGIQSSNPDVLKATINYREPVNDDMTINGLGASDYAYVYTEEISNLSPQLVTFDDIVYVTEIALVQVYLKSDRTIGKRVRAIYDPKLDGSFRDVFIIDVDKNRTADGVLTFNANVSPKTLTWDNGTPVQIPESGEYILYGENNVDWIRVYVNLANVPGSGSYSKTVSFPNSHLDEDLYLHICNVLWYAANGDLVGRNGVSDINTVDKRLFGTISKDNLRDDVFEFSKVLRNQILAETRGDGIVEGFHATNFSGTTLTIAGGRAYINGKRIEREGITYNTATDPSFIASASNRVCLDEDGNFEVVLVNAFTERRNLDGKYRIQIFDVTLDGGKNIIAWNDVRNGIGLVSPRVIGKRGEEPKPLTVGPIFNNLNATSLLPTSDRFHARWGDGVRGYSRIIIFDSLGTPIENGIQRILFTQNLRYDGTNWYKDVPTRGAFVKIFLTTGFDDHPTYGRSVEGVYYIPANAGSGPFALDTTTLTYWFTPSAGVDKGIFDFFFGKGADGSTNIYQVHFFNSAGSDVDIVGKNLIASDSLYVNRSHRIKYLGQFSAKGSLPNGTWICYSTGISAVGIYAFATFTFGTSHTYWIVPSLTSDGTNFCLFLKNNGFTTSTYDVTVRVYG